MTHGRLHKVTEIVNLTLYVIIIIKFMVITQSVQHYTDGD